jgi:hypothetical protein
MARHVLVHELADQAERNNLVVMFALGKGRKRFEHLEQPGLRCKASALDHANAHYA